MVANILSQALQQLKPNLRTNGFGVASTHRKLALFIPPSTKSPLFVYGSSPNQRSFLSLGSEEYEYDAISSDDEDHVDGGEVSRTVSLPSQISEATRDSELGWLLEEHQRMYSSVENSDNDDEEDEQDYEPGSQDYHGYEDNTDDFEHFMSRVRQNQQAFNHQHHGGHYGRKNSYRSIGSLSLRTDEDFEHEPVTVGSEIKMLTSYSIPLIITFLLEHIFSLVCVLVVSHLGKKELGAVSLATMTSNIIFAVFDGLSTVLDTLCPQAYGARDYRNVGVHFQRTTLLGMVLFIPFGLMWWFADKLLILFVDDEEVVHLTGMFLKVMIWGAPAYVIFENLKRYLQAQGIFEAGTYVLLICAPINVVLSYVLVWNKHVGLGFVGASLGVTINFWLMLLMLIGYTVFIDGYRCWYGWSAKAWTQWGELAKLAIPGIIMLEAESLSYEVLTLFASRFGASYLATQSAVSTIASLFYMSSFSIGIAASTRIANFVGARRIPCAKLAAEVGISSSMIIGLINGALMIIFRTPFAKLFSKDDEVIQMIVDIFPIIAVSTLFDSLNSVSGCCLRGQGMQRIGGFINMIAYYILGLPLAWLFGFYFDLRLDGLWYGMLIAFIVIGVSQSWVVLDADWDKIVEEADGRKADDEA